MFATAAVTAAAAAATRLLKQTLDGAIQVLRECAHYPNLTVLCGPKQADTWQEQQQAPALQPSSQWLQSPSHNCTLAKKIIIELNLNLKDYWANLSDQAEIKA